MRANFLLLSMLLAFLITIPQVLEAQVIADPMGLTSYLDEPGDTVETSLLLYNDGDEDVLYSLFVREINVDEDGGPRRDDRGGPDELEMEWRDSNEDDGPTYNWIDVTEYEDVVDIEDLQDDALAGTFELGFEITYYDNVYDQISIYPNGFATFTEQEIPFFYPWPELPSAEYDPEPPPTLNCVCYQDLNPAVAGNIYYWTDETMAVVTWAGVPHFDDGAAEEDLWTFQMIISAGGLIKYQYKEIGLYDVDPNQLSIMVGFQNEDQDVGFTIYRDEDGNEDEYLEAELAIGLGPTPAWINWVEFDPESGRLNSNDEVEIAIRLFTEDLESGVHALELTIALDDEDQGSIRLPLILTIGEDVGSIEGTVTSEATGDAVTDAEITIEPYGFVRYSDADGNFSLDMLPTGDYALTFSHPDFHPNAIEELAIEADDVADGSITLFHSEFTIADYDSVDVTLEEGNMEVIELTATNGGTGTTSYTVSKRLRGEFGFEPWEWREDIPVSEITGEGRLKGVAFAEGNYYLTGDNRGDTSKVHIVSMDGELTGSFNQPDGVDNDMVGLAFDGTYLWGSGTDLVYAMSLDGETESVLEGPLNRNNYIAFDPVDSLFYFASTTSDIVAMTYAGENTDLELDNHGMRMSGLGYWQDDPDGYCLYVIHAVEGLQQVTKMNVETNDTMNVFSWDEEDGEGTEFTITNSWDVYNWVFMCLIDDGANDQIRVWNLAAREDWYSISPLMGEIEPEGEQVFTLTLNSMGIPEGVFEGQLVFDHNGRGSQLLFNVNLEVTVPPPPDEPPSAFNILSPEDGSSYYAEEELEFVWQESIDPNEGDTVTYELTISVPDSGLTETYQSLDTSLVVDMQELYNALGENLTAEVTFNWLVTAISGDDRIQSDSTFSLRWQPDFVEEFEDGLPKEFSIHSVYPNPFNSTATLRYALDKTESISVSIYDHHGRLVSTSSVGAQSAGYHTITVDGSHFPSGIYFVKLQAGERVRSSKLILIK